MATAGAGSLLFHWGIGVAIIAICLLLEIFTQELGVIPGIGPFLVGILTPLRKDLLWVAVCTGLCMIVYSLGVHDESKRCVAKAEVVQTTVDKAVRRAVLPPANGMRDKFDSD